MLSASLAARSRASRRESRRRGSSGAIQRAHPTSADDHVTGSFDDYTSARPACRPRSACGARRVRLGIGLDLADTVRFSTAGLARISSAWRLARRSSRSCSILIDSSAPAGASGWRMSSAWRSLSAKRSITPASALGAADEAITSSRGQQRAGALEDVDAVGDLPSHDASAADTSRAKARPFAEQLQQALLRRPAVGSDPSSG